MSHQRGSKELKWPSHTPREGGRVVGQQTGRSRNGGGGAPIGERAQGLNEVPLCGLPVLGIGRVCRLNRPGGIDPTQLLL